MPNIKAKEKNVKKIAKANERNRNTKSRVKTAIRKAKVAVDAKDEQAPDLVRQAKKELDKAASKNIIHANNASRRSSRLDAYVKKSGEVKDGETKGPKKRVSAAKKAAGAKASKGAAKKVTAKKAAPAKSKTGATKEIKVA